jgi:hypothetical protein
MEGVCVLLAERAHSKSPIRDAFSNRHAVRNPRLHSGSSKGIRSPALVTEPKASWVLGVGGHSKCTSKGRNRGVENVPLVWGENGSC